MSVSSLTADDQIEVVIRRRANQAMAAILDVKDQLPLCEQDAVDLRRVILDEVNELVNLTIDLVRSMDVGEQPLVNYDVVRLIEQIHQAVVR